MRNSVEFVLLLICTAALSSCSDDNGRVAALPGQTSEYKSLEQKDDILHNLEIAYNMRNYAEVERMLDGGFVFYFSADDVVNGNVSNSSWRRTEELKATSNMLQLPGGASQQSPSRRRSGTEESTWGGLKELFYFETESNVPAVDQIFLDLNYEEGDDHWKLIEAPGAARSSGEPWYEKTLEYFLEVRAGQTTYSQNKTVLARFTVRPVRVDGKDIWQIIEWHDDVGN